MAQLLCEIYDLKIYDQRIFYIITIYIAIDPSDADTYFSNAIY